MVGRLIAAVYKMFGVFITYCHTSNYDESCFCCVLNRKHVRYNPPHVQTVLYARFVLLYSLSVSGVRWDGWRAPTENTGGRKQYEQCNTFNTFTDTQEDEIINYMKIIREIFKNPDDLKFLGNKK